MQAKSFWVAAVLTEFAMGVPVRMPAQGPTPGAAPPASTAPAPPVRRFGGFVPGQHRPPGDPVQIAHGKALYAVNCVSCHGVDLRGGDLGGPNLLRSQVALSDQNGELILPIIQGSRQDEGMPAIPIEPPDGLAVAAYIRSVVETIGSQGRPPSAGKEAPSILVGDANAGRQYFAAKCGSCHSATGDLQGIATRSRTPNRCRPPGWRAAYGDAVCRRRDRQASGPPPSPSRCRPGSVSRANWCASTTSWLRLDWPTATQRTIRRDDDVPKVEVHNPMQTHRDLMAVYTDKDIHDVTAYLVTLK